MLGRVNINNIKSLGNLPEPRSEILTAPLDLLLVSQNNGLLIGYVSRSRLVELSIHPLECDIPHSLVDCQLIHIC